MAELWVLHIIPQVNIWPKFRENPPRGKGGTERTRNSRQTHDLELWPWPWVSMVELLLLHIVSLRWTFDQSLKKILPLVQSGHEIQGSNLWPWTVTLTLCRHGWVTSSAHHLTEANIWPKFKENPSRGIGNMERTRNSRLKPMTLTCDLHLELTWLT